MAPLFYLLICLLACVPALSPALNPQPHQVDLIVCWDSAPPSRLRQRSGRTGRHRPGRVVHLLLEGREQDAYHANKQKETKVAVSLTLLTARQLLLT